MALAPNFSHRRMNDSANGVKTEPSSSLGSKGPRIDGLETFDSLEAKLYPIDAHDSPMTDEELNAWKSFAQTVSARDRDVSGWAEWAADNFSMLGGCTPDEIELLEERLMAGVLLGKTRNSGSRNGRPRGSTPARLFEPLQPDEYSPKGRDVYSHLKTVLTPRVLNDPGTFASVLRGINGDKRAGLEGYLPRIQRTTGYVLRERGLVENIAIMLNRLMPHQNGNAGPTEADDAAHRFEMLVSDIGRYMPGVKHALNKLPVYKHSQKPDSSGDSTGAPVRLQAAYVNTPQTGYRSPAAGTAYHRVNYVPAALSSGVPAGVSNAIGRARSPLPGLM